MKKILNDKIVIGGAVVTASILCATAISSTSKLNSLQNTIKEQKIELEEHKKNIEENKNKNKELREELDKALEKLEEAESRISKIQHETGVYNFKNATEIEWEVTFYSSLPEENSLQWGGINATGEPLANGMVANNNLPLGTKIYVKGHGVKTVEDRGSQKHFAELNRIDIFVPRREGETDEAYYKRVNNLGRKKLKGYIFEF